MRDYLRQQRDIYRYTHDQAPWLANSGATAHEIANTVASPGFAADNFRVRDYYGTLNHNLKAVYQFILAGGTGYRPITICYHRFRAARRRSNGRY